MFLNCWDYVKLAPRPHFFYTGWENDFQIFTNYLKNTYIFFIKFSHSGRGDTSHAYYLLFAQFFTYTYIPILRKIIKRLRLHHIFSILLLILNNYSGNLVVQKIIS